MWGLARPGFAPGVKYVWIPNTQPPDLCPEDHYVGAARACAGDVGVRSRILPRRAGDHRADAGGPYTSPDLSPHFADTDGNTNCHAHPTYFEQCYSDRHPDLHLNTDANPDSVRYESALSNLYQHVSANSRPDTHANQHLAADHSFANRPPTDEYPGYA